MNLTNEEMKQRAIENMTKLDIYKPYIKAFKDNGTKTQFLGYGGYYIDGELKDKVKEIENKYDILVYAVVPCVVEDMQMLSMLCVARDSEYDDVSDYNGYNIVFSYVLNETEPMFSEFGDVGIKSFGGGIARAW